MKRPRREPAGQTSTSLPLPARGRSYKRNQGKLWCLILTFVQVVYAAARFWEGGACCFVGGFVWDAAMVSGTEAVLLSVGLQHHFQEKDKRFGTRYVLLQTATSPKLETQLDRVTTRGCGRCEG